MEGSISLNKDDQITVHLDHKQVKNGTHRHRPVAVFLACRSDREIGIGIEILDKAERFIDDVQITIEEGRFVTVQVKPVHAFHRRFCIDGTAAATADKEWDKAEKTIEGHQPSEPIKTSPPTTKDTVQDQADPRDVESDMPERPLTVKEAAACLADGILHLKTDVEMPKPKTQVINVSSGILAQRLQRARDKVGELQDQLKKANHRIGVLQEQLDLEVRVAAENDRQLREQIANQHTELDRLRELEKQYRDVVSFFNTSVSTDGPKMTACQLLIKNTEDTIRARTERLLRFEIQGYVEAIRQIEQKRKNEQGSRIYYQELVEKIRGNFVEGCEAARGCVSDDLPEFVRLAVKIARQNGLGQEIKKIEGHHGN